MAIFLNPASNGRIDYGGSVPGFNYEQNVTVFTEFELLVAGEGNIVSKWSAADGRDMAIQITDTDEIGWASQAGDWHTIKTSGFNITLGLHRVAITNTFAAATNPVSQIYIDGSSIGFVAWFASGQPAWIPPTTSPFLIGREMDSPTAGINANFGPVAVWEAVLSGANLAGLTNGSISPASLTADRLFYDPLTSIASVTANGGTVTGGTDVGGGGGGGSTILNSCSMVT